MGGGGLTLSLKCPCGGGHRPWNEEEVRSCSNEFIQFSEGFCTARCAPNAGVSICPVMEISSLAALGASVTDLHHDLHHL